MKLSTYSNNWIIGTSYAERVIVGAYMSPCVLISKLYCCSKIVDNYVFFVNAPNAYDAICRASEAFIPLTLRLNMSSILLAIGAS